MDNGLLHCAVGLSARRAGQLPHQVDACRRPRHVSGFRCQRQLCRAGRYADHVSCAAAGKSAAHGHRGAHRRGHAANAINTANARHAAGPLCRRCLLFGAGWPGDNGSRSICNARGGRRQCGGAQLGTGHSLWLLLGRQRHASAAQFGREHSAGYRWPRAAIQHQVWAGRQLLRGRAWLGARRWRRRPQRFRPPGAKRRSHHHARRHGIDRLCRLWRLFLAEDGQRRARNRAHPRGRFLYAQLVDA